MKNKKGFTLIELLAVIVVLAIIALIATPIVLNLIDKAKVGAAESSSTAYVKAVENAVVKDMLYSKSYEDKTYEVGEIEANVSGTTPTKGNFTLEKGQVKKADLCINNYRIVYENYKSTRNGTCDEIVVKPMKIYEIGELVYFDPVSGDECSEETYTGKNTCYKWQVIEIADSSSKSTITLQMDHNLINKIAWAPSTNTTGPITALTELNKQTATWTRVEPLTYEYDTTAATSNYGKMTCTNGTCTFAGTTLENVKARMITGEEVRNITNTKVTDSSALSKKWTVASSNNDYFYFSNIGYKLGTTTSGTGDIDLAWLLENTVVYDNSGATSNGTDNYGYWTLSPVSDNADFAWRVRSYGHLSNDYVSNDGKCGVRPVITVSKSKI